jgi:hypothetical protein
VLVDQEDVSLNQVRLTPKAVDAVIRQDASDLGEEALAVLTVLARERLGIIPLRRLPDDPDDPSTVWFTAVGGWVRPRGSTQVAFPGQLSVIE